MSEFTPTTEQVWEQYTREQPPHIGTVSAKGEEFDRWHQAELRRAKAEAWSEGQKSGLRYADRAIKAHDMGRPDLPGPPSRNPYRVEATDAADS